MSDMKSYFERAGFGIFDVDNPVHHALAWAAYKAAKDREQQAIEERRSKARHRRYGAARRASTRARSSRSA